MQDDADSGGKGGGEAARDIGRTRLGNPANGDAPRPKGAVRVLMIGDMIGKPGRETVEALLPGLREERGIDFVTANGENVAGGMGLTPSTAESILAAGVDVITSGQPHLGQARDLPVPRGERPRPAAAQLRHARGPGPRLGRLQRPGRHRHRGRSTSRAARTCSRSRTRSPTRTGCSTSRREPLPPVRLVDFHCELTSEKNALGLYLDGRVSVVVGTHTHVVTGDERILPNGTAYQTDLGMTGPVWSVIGFAPRTVLPRFINALPTRFEVGEGPVVFNAVQVDIDPATGRALQIERIQRLVEG